MKKMRMKLGFKITRRGIILCELQISIALNVKILNIYTYYIILKNKEIFLTLNTNFNIKLYYTTHKYLWIKYLFLYEIVLRMQL